MFVVLLARKVVLKRPLLAFGICSASVVGVLMRLLGIFRGSV